MSNITQWQYDYLLKNGYDHDDVLCLSKSEAQELVEGRPVSKAAKHVSALQKNIGKKRPEILEIYKRRFF